MELNVGSIIRGEVVFPRIGVQGDAFGLKEMLGASGALGLKVMLLDPR